MRKLQRLLLAVALVSALGYVLATSRELDRRLPHGRLWPPPAAVSAPAP